MSLVNFRVDADRILVAVDSIGGASKHRLHMNKLFPIPHTNMLLCGRGSMNFLAKVSYVCGLMSGFDEVRAELPKALPGLLLTARVEAALYWALSLGRLGSPKLDAMELYVFGWSEQQEEMTAMRFTKRRGVRGFALDDDLAEGVGPALAHEFPVLDSVETMMRVANEQVTCALRDDPGTPIGGRLMVAELTRDAITLRSAGSINPDFMHLYRNTPA